MKPTGGTNKPEPNPSSANEGHLQSVGWISRPKSSRPPVEGELLLTSFFIELLENFGHRGPCTRRIVSVWRLLELCVFCLGFSENGNICVSIFPESKEVLIFGA